MKPLHFILAILVTCVITTVMVLLLFPESLICKHSLLGRILRYGCVGILGFIALGMWSSIARQSLKLMRNK